MTDKNDQNAPIPSMKDFESHSIETILEKVTIDALSLFSGYTIYFWEEVNRSLDFFEVKKFVFAASLLFVISDYLFRTYREINEKYLKMFGRSVKASSVLKFIWLIVLISVIWFGYDVNQKFESLSMKSFRFFWSFGVFMAISWGISLALNKIIKFFKDRFIAKKSD